jgi:hypothetical protein
MESKLAPVCPLLDLLFFVGLSLSLSISAFARVGGRTFPIWENKFKRILKSRSYITQSTLRDAQRTQAQCDLHSSSSWTTCEIGGPVCCL